jgi:uncharacterized protein YlxP (DUF503 family)
VHSIKSHTHMFQGRAHKIKEKFEITKRVIGRRKSKSNCSYMHYKMTGNTENIWHMSQANYVKSSKQKFNLIKPKLYRNGLVLNNELYIIMCWCRQFCEIKAIPSNMPFCTGSIKSHTHMFQGRAHKIKEKFEITKRVIGRRKSKYWQYNRQTILCPQNVEKWHLFLCALLGYLVVKLKSVLRKFYGTRHDLVKRFGRSVSLTTTYVSSVVITIWSFPYSAGL